MKKTFLIGIMCVFFALLNTHTAFSKGNSTPANTTDTMLTSKVQDRLKANPATKATTIVVETKDGVVILSGVADSEKEVIEAVEIAAATPGVVDVDVSGIKPKKSSKPMGDSYTTAKVKGVLIREKLLGNADLPALDIKVVTRDGVVYLTGQVENVQQKKEAINIARSIKGVKRVVPNIKIKKQ